MEGHVVGLDQDGDDRGKKRGMARCILGCMFYLSNWSAWRLNVARNGAACHVTTKTKRERWVHGVIYGVQHLTAFCSLLHHRCYAASQFPPFFCPPPHAPLVMPRSLRAPSRFPVANKSRWNFHLVPPPFEKKPKIDPSLLDTKWQVDESDRIF